MRFFVRAHRIFSASKAVQTCAAKRKWELGVCCDRDQRWLDMNVNY